MTLDITPEQIQKICAKHGMIPTRTGFELVTGYPLCRDKYDNTYWIVCPSEADAIQFKLTWL